VNTHALHTMAGAHCTPLPLRSAVIRHLAVAGLKRLFTSSQLSPHCKQVAARLRGMADAIADMDMRMGRGMCGCLG
jgi:hypothetical protein